MAQPSGMALTADGDLAFLDAEASALRVLRAGTFAVETLVGAGLFAWGEDDGDSERARLQHPLGLTLGADGELYIADTFNDAIRVWRGAHLWTVPVEGFAEPGGIAALPDGRLLVADTGNHRIVRVDPLRARAVALDVGRPSLGRHAGRSARVGRRDDRAARRLDARGLARPRPRRRRPRPGGRPADPRAGRRRRARRCCASRRPGRRARCRSRVDLALGEGSGRVTVELLAATCGSDACRLRRTQRAYDVLLT